MISKFIRSSGKKVVHATGGKNIKEKAKGITKRSICEKTKRYVVTEIGDSNKIFGKVLQRENRLIKVVKFVGIT